MNKFKINSKLGVVQALSLFILCTTVSLIGRADDTNAHKPFIYPEELSFQIDRTSNNELRSKGRKIKIVGSFVSASNEIKSIRAVVQEGQRTNSFPVRAVVPSKTCLTTGACSRQHFEITFDAELLGFDRTINVQSLIVDYKGLGTVIHETRSAFKAKTPYVEGLEQKPILTEVSVKTAEQKIRKSVVYNPMSEGFDVWEDGLEKTKQNAHHLLQMSLKSDKVVHVESYEVVIREKLGRSAKYYYDHLSQKYGEGTYEANGVLTGRYSLPRVHEANIVPKAHSVFIAPQTKGETVMKLNLSIPELARKKSFLNWLLSKEIKLNQMEIIGVRVRTISNGSLDLSFRDKPIDLTLPAGLKRRIETKRQMPGFSCFVSLGGSTVM